MDEMIDTAVIIAGGKGTRLRPLTLTTPKPLVQIKGIPIIEHTINQLKLHGVKKVVLSIGYLANKIIDYFGDGSNFGVNIRYVIEDTPLGTGGATKQASDELAGPFFLIWGDNLMDINYSELANTYNKHKDEAQVIMTLTPRDDVDQFGVAKLVGEKIEFFVEKPKPEDAPSNLINAGAFVLHPKALEILPEGKSNIERQCFEILASEGKISSYKHTGQWFATDNFERYNDANTNFIPIDIKTDSKEHLGEQERIENEQEKNNFEDEVQVQEQITELIANPKIFKAYDIRGEWNKDWNEAFAYKIGKALAKHFKPKTVVIGRDMRTSSDIIFDQIAKALTEQGVNVKDLGLCATELTYYANSFIEGVDLALMITASHNPAKDNGIKITANKGISVGLDSGLSQVRDFAISEDITDLPHTEIKGTIEKIDLWPWYKKFVFSKADINNLSKLKIVVDAGNGMGGYMFDKVLGEKLDELGCEIVRMYWKPDGTFPNHPADPSREDNTVDLQNKVVEVGADIGIAYDGDGDRIFITDNKGRYVHGYYFVALMTDYLLGKNPNASQETVIHDPRYYWATRNVINKHGANAVMSKVGHTLIKKDMRKHNSPFSMECSGHTFFRETNFSESSMLGTLIVLQIIKEKGQLSNILDPYFENHPISGENNFLVDDTNAIMAEIEEKYGHGQVSKLDGVGIEFPEWRFIVRTSNTQPLLRLNIEAKSQTIVDEKMTELMGIIGGEKANH
jgi:phosphomannomutase